MGDKVEKTVEERIIHHFTNIKNISDSGIAMLTNPPKQESEDSPDLFELTEKIQEEIEEIRDLIFA
jgi:hypothetical protein